ncbi:MAG TPA: hypothetical protein VHM67_08195 [Gemmatimonadaceae bacterium]|nr:hypothetical protein [Gemmatimonadaceae bacterium]
MFRPLTNLVRRVAVVAALLTTLPVGAHAQMQLALDSKKDMLEVQSFHLTMAIMKQLIESQEGIYATIAAQPQLVSKYQQINAANDPSEKVTLDVLAARFERVPEMKEQIENAGLTPRMYLLATMAFLETINAAEKLKDPTFNRRTLPPSVLANYYFMDANQEALGPMFAHVNELEAKMNAAVAQQAGQQATPATPPDQN